jgi:phosphate transport system protein
MSPADSADAEPLRHQFTSELHELKLQTEVMGVLVDQNLERMRDVLVSGNESLALQALTADDDIDAMNVSLTDQCYRVLGRENPMASDLRLVVSVVRVIGSFERIGDLSLRVVKLAPEQALIASNPESFDILQVMADVSLARFRDALKAWATDDGLLAEELSCGSRQMDLSVEKLTEALLRLDGPDAVRLAIRSLVVGQALQRISDHATMLGRRIQYLITGDPAHLAAEVR